MPWRIRWQVGMILLGVAALTIGIIVLARNTTKLDIELLASLGIIGGLAIILNGLPRNGNDKKGELTCLYSGIDDAGYVTVMNILLTS